MSAEIEAATPWPYALTLVTPEGPREFRFRIDPVEPEKPFGRAGNSLRAESLPPVAGFIVAEKLIPWTSMPPPDHPVKARGYWTLPDFHEVSAIARAAEPGLGRLRASRATFTMPDRCDDLGPLEVLEVRWSRWEGRVAEPAEHLRAVPKFEITERGLREPKN